MLLFGDFLRLANRVVYEDLTEIGDLGFADLEVNKAMKELWSDL